MTHSGPSSGWGRLLIALLLVWVFFILGAYYAVQKPFDVVQLQRLLQPAESAQSYTFSIAALVRTILDILAACWILAAATGVGIRIWRWFGLAQDDGLIVLLFSTGLGCGALGLAVLFVGLAGWLTPTWLISLLAVLTILALPPLVQLRHLWRRPRIRRLTLLYLLLATTLVLTLALLPPTSWDSLSYHLEGPRLYLQAGRIYPGIDIYAVNNPFTVEMLFTLGLAIRGEATAQLIHLAFLALLSGMVYLAATRLLKLRQGWTAVLLLYAIPMSLAVAPWTYNDLALSFFILGSLCAYLVWDESGQRAWLVIAGLFAGLAMSVKYTSFVAPAVLGVLILWRNRRQIRQGILQIGTFSLPALFVALPWYVKNWRFTGNPIYPFLFGGELWDSYRTAAHNNPGSGIGFDPVALLRLPFDAVLGIHDINLEAPLGPLTLALLPMLLWFLFAGRRRPKPAGLTVLALFALGYYAFWVLGVIYSENLWQGRLLLPVFAALCPAIAWAIGQTRQHDHPQFSLHRMLRIVLALTLLLGLIDLTFDWLAIRPMTYVAGDQSRDAYLHSRLGTLYDVTEFIDARLPATAVVQMLWEPRSYYCRQPCRNDLILDKYAHLEHQTGSAAGVAQAMRDEGVTYVLVHEAGLRFLLEAATPWVIPADMDSYSMFLTQHLAEVAEWPGAYTLYELIQ